jgi:hypothetical protein
MLTACIGRHGHASLQLVLRQPGKQEDGQTDGGRAMPT